MHPVLITIGSFQLPTYGLLLAIGLGAALVTIVRLGRREGLDASRLVDFSTWLIVVGLVGAKVLMILTDWSFYRHNPGEIFSMATLRAGGVFYGGFAAAALFAARYVRVYQLPAWKVFDVYAPAIALGQSIGRLGCFAAGCDYGKPTKSFLHVVFTNPISQEVSGVPLGVPLHPAQLYEALANLAIFGILLWRYQHKRRDGEVFVLYLALYAVGRFFLEFLRGDEDRGFVFHHLLSTSQFIAILALAAAAILTTVLRRRAPVAQPVSASLGPEVGRPQDAVATVAGRRTRA
jgi:phosphatidylglycerol:prolipoprotein diacylglycerol transferase